MHRHLDSPCGSWLSNSPPPPTIDLRQRKQLAWKILIEYTRYSSYNRLDVVYKNSSRGLPVPSPVPASTNKEPSAWIHHFKHTTKSEWSNMQSLGLDSHIWETIPPWWPGMILNCIRPLASPSPASAAFHNRMLSLQALKRCPSIICWVEWRYRYDEARCPSVTWS
jgi:hypothetical protein